MIHGPIFKVSRPGTQALVYEYLWADKTKVSRLCESREAETNTLYSSSRYSARLFEFSKEVCS